jgi:hypothetical protein
VLWLCHVTRMVLAVGLVVLLISWAYIASHLSIHFVVHHVYSIPCLHTYTIAMEQKLSQLLDNQWSYCHQGTLTRLQKLSHNFILCHIQFYFWVLTPLLLHRRARLSGYKRRRRLSLSPPHPKPPLSPFIIIQNIARIPGTVPFLLPAVPSLPKFPSSSPSFPLSSSSHGELACLGALTAPSPSSSVVVVVIGPRWTADDPRVQKSMHPAHNIIILKTLGKCTFAN